MWLFLYFQVCIDCILVATEVITLIKDDEAVCVSIEDTANSPIYIDKLNQPYNLYRSAENIENLNFVDWESTNDAKYLYAVFDERWIDFKFEHTRKRFNDYNNVLTVSVCTKDAVLEAKIFSKYNTTTYSIPTQVPNISSSCRWNHLRIRKNYTDNKTQLNFYAMGGLSSVDYITFDPEWVIFDSVYKFHTYNFWYSTNISLKTSHINVRQPHKCISMYISVDKGCFLNVTLLSGNETITKIVNETNEKNTLRSWKKLAIATTNVNQNGIINFLRGRYDNGPNGYWAVDDIRICNNLPVSVARTRLPKNRSADDDLVCKNLIEANATEYAQNFCDRPSFGKNCNITCDEILGLPFSNCENYRIKLGGESHCAWGYHGPNCTQACGPNYWGMDCKKECEIGCANCDATLGCTECKSTYLPTNCSQKLPIVTQAPTLISLTDTTITVFFNLTYGEDEVYPDSYIIQYKHGNKNFINHLGRRNYIPSVEMNINITREATCRIRIILLHKHFSVSDNIPELVVPKEFFKAKLIANNTVSLAWSSFGERKIYTIEYDCVEDLCTRYHEERYTIKTNLKISVWKSFHTCVFTLFLTEKGVTKTINQTEVYAPNFINEIKKEELPKSVRVYKNYTVLELENCKQFTGALNYSLNCKCINEWCKNETKVNEYTLRRYHRTINLSLSDLSAFNSYEIKLTASRRGQTSVSKTYYWFSTPPSEPLEVENASVYGVNGDNLFVRWTEPYPPTGEIEMYTLSLKNNATGHTVSNINTTAAVCSVWKNFICAKIPGVTNLTILEVKVRAKNQNVLRWGRVTSISGVVRNETSAPDGLRINPSHMLQQKIILTWNHPTFVCGILKLFQITVTHGYQTVIITTDVITDQQNYNAAISVEPEKNYSISIWAINSNNEDGEKMHIFLAVFRSIPDFSRGGFIKWYSNDSKKSYLILPKPSKEYVNFNVSVSKIDVEVICSDMICEINETSNLTYYLNYDNNTVIINPIIEDEQNLGLASILTFVLPAITFGFLLVVYLRYAYKQRKFPFKKHENQEDNESTELQEKDAFLNKSTGNDSTSINIENLENYILESLKSDPDHKKIKKEFLAIPTMAMSCNLGRSPENYHKNRYENILPYDDTRVILRDYHGGDYINANYINTHKATKKFIATQSPLESTIHDFWFMVCQENAKIIVMLMKQEENDGTKCARYWPSNSSCFKFGKFLIETVEVNVTPDYTRRKLQVKFQDQTNLVQLYQYTAWSDDDVPSYTGSFTTFIQEVMRFQQSSPIIVHCSTGCDRTGTFILCCMAIEMGQKEHQVDFCRILKELRKNRPNMLSSVHQYIFAHSVILEYFFGQYENIS